MFAGFFSCGNLQLQSKQGLSFAYGLEQPLVFTNYCGKNKLSGMALVSFLHTPIYIKSMQCCQNFKKKILPRKKPISCIV